MAEETGVEDRGSRIRKQNNAALGWKRPGAAFFVENIVYGEAIAKCHIAGESTIFIEFLLSQIDQLLDEMVIQIDEENEYLSEAVKKLLDVMEYDIPYTSKTLMERLELKSREGFRRNYLQPAMKWSLIQMTIPDKPNSRNQRYIKK